MKTTMKRTISSIAGRDNCKKIQVSKIKKKLLLTFLRFDLQYVKICLSSQKNSSHYPLENRTIERTLLEKMKYSIENFFSKCDQIHSFLRIWSHLLTKSLMENFIFCAVIHKMFRGYQGHLLNYLEATTGGVL